MAKSVISINGGYENIGGLLPEVSLMGLAAGCRRVLDWAGGKVEIDAIKVITYSGGPPMHQYRITVFILSKSEADNNKLTVNVTINTSYKHSAAKVARRLLEEVSKEIEQACERRTSELLAAAKSWEIA